MKNFCLILAMVLVGSLAFALDQTYTINCGDVHRGYVDIDLSDSFKSDFAQSIMTAQLEGQRKSLAGRNCVAFTESSEVEYEVLFMLSHAQPLLRDLVQPFGIASARIDLQIMDPSTLKYGLVLTGKGSDLQSANSMVTAKLSLARTLFFSGITMIIRQR